MKLAQQLAGQVDIPHIEAAYDGFLRFRQLCKKTELEHPNLSKEAQFIYGLHSGGFIVKLLFNLHHRMYEAALEWIGFSKMGNVVRAKEAEDLLQRAGALCRRVSQDPEFSVRDAHEAERFGWLAEYVAEKNYRSIAESWDQVRRGLREFHQDRYRPLEVETTSPLDHKVKRQPESEQTQCRACGSPILVTTAGATGGYCRNPKCVGRGRSREGACSNCGRSPCAEWRNCPSSYNKAGCFTFPILAVALLFILLLV